jgi:CubicO group peptidase (beta-lactamase class C family)
VIHDRAKSGSTIAAPRLPALHVILAAVLLLAAGEARAQQQSLPDDRTVEEAVESALSRSFTPGAVIAIVVHDSVAFLRAYGMTALDGERAPLTADALFQAGALSELVNALIAVRLEHAGTLDLDAPIGPLISDLPRRFRDITLDQLLTHTAGMSFETAVPGRGGANDLGAAARGLTPLDRFAPGGTMYSFSTPGLQLSGLAIERAAKKPYAVVARDAVLAPLGMTRSTFDFTAAKPHLTIGWHGSRSIDARLQPATFSPGVPMHVPVNGFHTTAADAARLALALLNDGVVGGERLLPEGVVASLLEPRADIPFTTTRAGRGLRLSMRNGRRTIAIAGGSTGHSVSIDLLPDERIGVVVLTNRSGNALGGIANLVFRHMLGETDALRESPAPADSGSLALLAAHTGRYLNGAELIEIVTRDGVPVMKSGDLMLPLRPLDDGELAALIDNRVALVFRMFVDSTGRPWLWLGNRALGREVPR